MHYVYILQSKADATKIYVGKTNNLDRRLEQHNLFPTCSYTIKYKPWELKTYVAFNTRNKADEFELYLKSHSGKAFTQRHL